MREAALYFSSKGKIFIAISLGLALFFRLAYWQARQRAGLVLCAQSLSEPQRISLKGALEFNPNGHWEIVDWRLLTKAPSFQPAALFFIPAFWAKAHPSGGHLLRLDGSFSCSLPSQNFAFTEDGGGQWRAPRFSLREKRANLEILLEPESWEVACRRRFSIFLETLFAASPGLLGLVKAVWTGSTEGLPESVLKLYQEGGLLQILALSGQHVNALLLLVHLVLRLFGRYLLGWDFSRRYYAAFLLFLPTACSLLLCFTSDWSPSVVRTLGMALALMVLRLQCFSVPIVQLLASSLAYLILWDPALLSGPSFLLSAGATYLLIQLSQSNHFEKAITEYFFISLLMPVLVLPFTAFFFGKISVSAPLNNLCLGWLWDLFLIPLGFLLPLAALIPQGLRGFLLAALEQGWLRFLEFHQHALSLIELSYFSVWRPSLLELLVIEGSVLSFLLGFARFLKRLSQRGIYAALRFDFFRQKVSNY